MTIRGLKRLYSLNPYQELVDLSHCSPHLAVKDLRE